MSLPRTLDCRSPSLMSIVVQSMFNAPCLQSVISMCVETGPSPTELEIERSHADRCFPFTGPAEPVSLNLHMSRPIAHQCPDCKAKACRKHTPHKVTQYKKGKDSLAAQGKRRYDRRSTSIADIEHRLMEMQESNRVTVDRPSQCSTRRPRRCVNPRMRACSR